MGSRVSTLAFRGHQLEKPTCARPRDIPSSSANIRIVPVQCTPTRDPNHQAQRIADRGILGTHLVRWLEGHNWTSHATQIFNSFRDRAAQFSFAQQAEAPYRGTPDLFVAESKVQIQKMKRT